MSDAAQQISELAKRDDIQRAIDLVAPAVPSKIGPLGPIVQPPAFRDFEAGLFDTLSSDARQWFLAAVRSCVSAFRGPWPQAVQVLAFLDEEQVLKRVKPKGYVGCEYRTSQTDYDVATEEAKEQLVVHAVQLDKWSMLQQVLEYPIKEATIYGVALDHAVFARQLDVLYHVARQAYMRWMVKKAEYTLYRAITGQRSLKNIQVGMPSYDLPDASAELPNLRDLYVELAAKNFDDETRKRFQSSAKEVEGLIEKARG